MPSQTWRTSLWVLAVLLVPASAQPAGVYPYRGKFYRIENRQDPEKVVAKPPDSWRVNTWQGPWLSVAETEQGPFTALPGPYTPAGFIALDGSLYVEGDIPWLVYVHDWTQVVDSFIEAVPLKADLTAAAGEPVYLFKASDALWHRAQTEATPEPRVYPASHPVVRRSPGGALEIHWSSPRQGQAVANVARSMSGRMRGPWKQVK